MKIAWWFSIVFCKRLPGRVSYLGMFGMVIHPTGIGIDDYPTKMGKLPQCWPMAHISF